LRLSAAPVLFVADDDGALALPVPLALALALDEDAGAIASSEGHVGATSAAP
jgi:hypothetical protein